MKSNGSNGHRGSTQRSVRFDGVVPLLRGDSPAGFRKARDIVVQSAGKAPDLPIYVALKLAIELDRHAIFVEVAADKSRSKFDYEAYQRFHQWLAGETDVPVAMGLPAGPAMLTPQGGVEADVVGEEPEEEPDDG